MKHAVIISASSDIGAALAKKWSQEGWKIYGTYRTPSPLVSELAHTFGVQFVPCNLTDVRSLTSACLALQQLCPKWDVLVMASGSVEPIGPFLELDFDRWEESIQVNCVRQLKIVHQLLPSRNVTASSEPVVLFFAGGGTNHAVCNYSGYTLSKIALIKMCEFLDAEIPDTRFVILGPGCVKTKIHEPTLKLAHETQEAQYRKTLERLQTESRCVPMDRVVDSCHWLVTTACKHVRGRNFSTEWDRWGSQLLEEELESDPDMYKLRRHKNSWVPAKC